MQKLTPQDSLYSEWADHYIAYSALKKQIKANLPWSDTAEAEFLRSLRDELTKCETFQADKAADSMRKIEALEREVHAFVEEQELAEQEAESRDEEDPESGSRERNARRHRDDDGGSDDDDDDEDDDGASAISETEAEEKFKAFEDEVAVLVADVHDLALFTKLNFTGFQKIVKKHDVSLPSRCWSGADE